MYVLHVGVCVIRVKCFLRVRIRCGRRKYQAYLDMNKLFALSANIILLLRTAERIITPAHINKFTCFRTHGEENTDGT